MSQPWEQQVGESDKAYAAFCVYRDMGAERSIARVSQQLSKSIPFLKTWSARYKWDARASAWLQHLDAVRRDGMAQSEKSAAMKRHLDNSRRIATSLLSYSEEALELALRSVRAYKNLPPESVQPGEAASLARTALSAAQSGLDAEAHSLGVETVVSALEGDDG